MDEQEMSDRDIMTPGEVAEYFRVDTKTVVRWANEGKLPSFRTPGGHRRYRRGDVRAAAEQANLH